MYRPDENSWANRSKKYKRRYLSAMNQLYGTQIPATQEAATNDSVNDSGKEAKARRAGRADQARGVVEKTGDTSPGKR